jgi:hypothetical protein
MALIDKLEKFAGKLKPGRNTIKGFPVDIDDSSDGHISMDAVDSDAAKGLVKALRAAKFKAKRDGNVGITISEGILMKTWKQIVNEMTSARRDKENQKAYKRINDFWDRAKGDQAKFSAQINLRTKKMTKVEKVQIWASELENQNFHDEAEVAFARLKQLGVKGA